MVKVKKPRKVKKVKEVSEEQAVEEVAGVAEVRQEIEPVTPTPALVPTKVLTPREKAIAESREVLLRPLSPEQQFFEAPDGFIIIGEKGRGRVFYRGGDNGKGMWINPRRE